MTGVTMTGDISNPAVWLGGGVLAAVLGGAGLMHIGKKHLESLPTVRGNPSAFKDTKKDYKLNVGYMNSPATAGNNAFFATKEDIEDILKDSKDNPFVDAKAATRMLRAAKQHGLVVTGKGFKKPGVIEHELGHAIATHKGTPWEKFTHSGWAPALGELGALAGIGIGGRVALHGPAGLKRRGLAALTAGGIAGLSNVPLVSRELTANRYGQELLDDDMADKVKNWPFVGTYINGAVTQPMVTSALIRASGPAYPKFRLDTGAAIAKPTVLQRLRYLWDPRLAKELV